MEKPAEGVDLKGIRVVVTGASSGLGYAMAKAVGKAGASVLLTARNEENLAKAVRQLQEEGCEVFGFTMDVRSEESITRAVQWAKNKWGTLDVLVNNAGIGMRTVNPVFLTDPKPFFEVTADGFRDLIDTNLTGYFLVAKAFVPLLLENKKGKIINISMNHETMKRKGFIPYGPSRAGAESLSCIMAEDLKDYHIDVNMLLPGGATETGMIPDNLKASFREKGFLLDPEVMAEPIKFLVSNASDGITGERIIAKGFAKWKQNREAVIPQT